MNTTTTAPGLAPISTTASDLAPIVVIFVIIGIVSIIGVLEYRKLRSAREVKPDPVPATLPSTEEIQRVINRISTHESESSICPSCSKPLRAGDRFCSQCGYRLIKETPSILPAIKNTFDLTCPGCHATLHPQDQFCGTCGAHTAQSNDATQWHSQ
jgi:hypothetical protein